MIDVDAPTLAYEGAPGVAALELPIDVLIGPVKSMGAVAGPESMNVFEYVVFRRLTLGLRPRRVGRVEQGVVPAGNPFRDVRAARVPAG